MEKIKFLILGAGPTGITAAHALIDNGIPSHEVVVLEKEQLAGGLCRSEEVDGSALDIGGGHFLDVRRANVLEFLFRFMPSAEWNTFERVSKIRLRGQEVDHPLEANLWQLSVADQVDFLESIAQAGCVRGEPKPELFSDWIVWKLGERIANEYMLPYNRKIWSLDPNQLGTYWLHKLPSVSFREILQSCLEKRALGQLPAHGTFLYPKCHGYGEVWRRMGEALEGQLKVNSPIFSLDIDSRTINDQWQAETIINTIPWAIWPSFCNVPDHIERQIRLLHNISIDVDYLPETLDNPSHWIYEPDESVAHHRLLLRSNFCTGSRGHWTETNAARSAEAEGWRHHNEYAYPVNTIEKPAALARILSWAESQGIIGMGRWGKWEHMNSDVAVDEALTAVNSLLHRVSN